MQVFSAILWLSLSVLADSGAEIQSILKEASASAADAGEPGYGLLAQIALCQAKAGDRSAAVATFDRSLEAAGRIQDERAKRMFLAYLAEARGEAGDVAGALHTVQQISDADSEAYARSLIAAAQAKAGEIEAAFATADSIDPKFIRSRVYALSDVAVAAAKAGRINESDTTIDLIANDVRKIRALREIARIQTEAGDLDGAKRRLELALRIAKNAKAEGQIGAIADDQAAVGDIAGALQTTALLPVGPKKAYALLAVAAAQTKAGDRDAAKSTFQEGLRMIRSSNVDALDSELKETSVRLARTGDLDGAMELASIITNPGVREYALRLIAVDQLTAGNIDGALQIAERIDGSYNKAFALREIAVAQTRVDAQVAEATFQKASQISDGIDDGYGKASTLREIAVAQTRVDAQAAEVTFRKAFQAACAIEVGGGTDVIALRELGRAQAKTGNIAAAAKVFQQARQAAMQCKDDSYVASLFQNIAAAQAEGGDAEGALAWAKTLTVPVQRAAALLGVASGLLRHGDGNGAPAKQP